MRSKTKVIHLIKDQTISANGYIQAHCRLMQESTNKTTKNQNEATCKLCRSMVGRSKGI